MTSMSFIPELRDFLREHKAIYTVRRYKMVDAIVKVRDMGEYHRIPVAMIQEKEDLEPYVSESGFGSAEHWWKKIKYFIPQLGVPKYLYRVEKVE